jgi:hypothetical protein
VDYVLAATFVHYLENLHDCWKQAGGVIAGNERLLAALVWPHFRATKILLLVILFMHCTPGRRQPCFLPGRGPGIPVR